MGKNWGKIFPLLRSNFEAPIGHISRVQVIASADFRETSIKFRATLDINCGGIVARINIETSVYSDFRFQDLLIKLGNRHLAKGQLQELWELAQQFWFPQRGLIPEDVFIKSGLSETLIETGWAERRSTGIYVRGSEKHFDWLFEKQEAGRASAEARKKKYGTAQPRPAVHIEQNSNTTEHSSNTVEQPRTSLLSSLSSYSKKENTLKATKQVSRYPDFGSSLEKSEKPIRPAKEEAVRLEKERVARIIGTYIKAFQARYGEKTRPSVSGKVIGQLKNLLKTHTEERLTLMVQVYCQMEDSWFLKKHHDITTFLENLNKIAVALDTGVDPERAPKVLVEAWE